MGKHDRYPGLPTMIGRSKKQAFNMIHDRVWKKLKGWKEKILSRAGKEVLIKAVAQARPTYCMSCFRLPHSLCEELTQMIAKFWWGQSGEESKIHWLNWKKLCTPKKDGGLGFRDFHCFNLAMLSKQGWRMIQDTDSLLTRVLRARYYPRGDFLSAK